MKQIQVVGIGLNGSQGLAEDIQEIIHQSTVLVGSDRALSYFPDYSGEKIILGDIFSVFSQVAYYFHRGESVAILVSGDPLFFGLGRLLLEKFPPENLSFYPHLTSVQLAFNRLKVPWQDARFVSVHGRSLEGLKSLLQEGVDKIAILTDTENNPCAIASFYLSLSLPISYHVYICENLESPEEQIVDFPPEEIYKLANNYRNFSNLNIVVFLRQKNVITPQELPLLGLPDEVFHSFSDQPGLMTKKEIRTCILGEMSLYNNQIIWDIGAGTGSVSVEMARLSPTSRIYAIEKTAMGISLIQKNCQQLEVTNVTPIYGTAPEILEDLPAPHRVFIGGSGGNLENILTIGAGKLQADGLIIISLTTLEHQNTCLTWLKQHGWNYYITGIQINRSIAVGKYTRLSPLNPVTLVVANPGKCDH
ncbi:MAG: Cobalamin biosynthesis bifunctional protein CbiET [Chroococcopsis gigantea SAG 12.99]|nr:precorrin-6y C5,15-methyltransferase (decarboxylating) subunit CbiE [Chlorogloea purpurea SAG 13.99]MDV2999666.1 Cobalamin biosynthesis bifunctional protein CbiET [Chroococcopsis gigantea SAG 12.99]